MSDDNVNHPKHYQGSNGIESIQVIEGFDLSYNCGTAAAYIMRAKRKGGVEDLKKAVWHLQREIAGLESTAAATSGNMAEEDLVRIKREFQKRYSGPRHGKRSRRK